MQFSVDDSSAQIVILMFRHEMTAIGSRIDYDVLRCVQYRSIKYRFERAVGGIVFVKRKIVAIDYVA